MHVPDGFLDLPTSVATGVVAATFVGLSLRHARRVGDDRVPARAGLTAAFVFAAQMVNFPVGAGTSGHLIGAGLAVALLGPWTATLVLACVLLVQGLFFADGGLTALGTNITLMAVVAVWVAHGVSTLVAGRIADRDRAATWGAALGAGVSVPVAALAFCGLYAVGGTAPVPLGLLTSTMLGVHALIGVGEAVITGLVVRSVVALRPDLVALIGPDARGAADAPGVRWGLAAFGVTLAVAGGLSLFASSSPDGLEWTAEALRFGDAAQASASAVSPLADYDVAALGPLGPSVAGVVGVLSTLAGCALLLRAVRAAPRPA